MNATCDVPKVQTRCSAASKNVLQVSEHFFRNAGGNLPTIRSRRIMGKRRKIGEDIGLTYGKRSVIDEISFVEYNAHQKKRWRQQTKCKKSRLVDWQESVVVDPAIVCAYRKRDSGDRSEGINKQMDNADIDVQTYLRSLAGEHAIDLEAEPLDGVRVFEGLSGILTKGLQVLRGSAEDRDGDGVRKDKELGGVDDSRKQEAALKLHKGKKSSKGEMRDRRGIFGSAQTDAL
ncbi:hypothetical protein FB451DRAFT_1369408 [Mycena latifolia]|nr:hypothetical protein FB451DRAFT_1369408 [Mycena latifolia]